MKYDVIVVGLGVYGSAVAAEAGKRGFRTLAVDEFDPPHDLAASHGSTRIFRHTAVESEGQMGLAKRAADLWRKLDGSTAGELLIPTPFALITSRGCAESEHHGTTNLTERAASIAERYQVSYRRMHGSSFSREYGGLNIEPTADVFLEDDSFLIRPELAVKTLIASARSCPTVEVVVNSRARNATPVEDGLDIDIDGQRVSCRRLILCTGAWQHADILGHSPIQAAIVPQLSISAAVAAPSKFPAFAYIRPDELAYGTPATEALMEIKIGVENDPRDMQVAPKARFSLDVGEQESARALKAAADLLSFGPKMDWKFDRCFYTVTKDSQHIVQRWNQSSDALIVSACSGHGFKYAPAIAENIVESFLGSRPPSTI